MAKQPTELEKIRNAINEIELKRFNEQLSKEEIDILELSSMALREAERVEIAKIEKKIVSEMKTSTEKLKEFAAKIRGLVSDFSKHQKNLDKIESVIKEATEILSHISKW